MFKCLFVVVLLKIGTFINYFFVCFHLNCCLIYYITKKLVLIMIIMQIKI